MRQVQYLFARKPDQLELNEDTIIIELINRRLDPNDWLWGFILDRNRDLRVICWLKSDGTTIRNVDVMTPTDEEKRRIYDYKTGVVHGGPFCPEDAAFAQMVQEDEQLYVKNYKRLVEDKSEIVEAGEFWLRESIGKSVVQKRKKRRKVHFVSAKQLKKNNDPIRQYPLETLKNA